MVNFDGKDLFLITGELHAFQTSRSRSNLFAQLEERIQTGAVAGTVDAALNAMFSILSTGTDGILFDDDEVHNIAALLDGRIICGSFREGEQLAEGDAVSAVVSRQGDVFVAHSVLRKRDHVLLLPDNVHAGEQSQFRSAISTFCRGVLGWWLFSSLVAGVTARAELQAMPLDRLIILGCIMLLGPILVMGIVEVPTYRSMRYYGWYASAIFKVYGFPHPADFNALKGMRWMAGGRDGFVSIDANLALAKHAKKFKLAAQANDHPIL